MRARLQALNAQVRDHDMARAPTLRPAPSSPQAGPVGCGREAGVGGVLVIKTPIAALRDFGGEQEGGGRGRGAMRVQLVDTPGPNEAGEEQLKFAVRGVQGVWSHRRTGAQTGK